MMSEESTERTYEAGREFHSIIFRGTFTARELDANAHWMIWSVGYEIESDFSAYLSGERCSLVYRFLC